MANDRENKLEALLRDIINDFDQTGCSEGVGVVATTTINEARGYLGLDLLEDEEGLDKDEDESETLDPDEIDPDDDSTP